MIKFLFTILLSLNVFAQTQVVTGDIFPDADVNKNFIRNPMTLQNLLSVTATTHSLTRNTTSPIMGSADFQISPGAAGNVAWTLKPHENFLTGQNCEFKGLYTGGGGTWTAEIFDGTNIISSTSLPAVTQVTPFSVIFPCGSGSPTRTVRFRTTASAPQLNVDQLYYGVVTRIGQFSAPTLYMGGMENAGASSCAYIENSSTGLSNFVALGTGTSCAAWTVENAASRYGTISAQGTNDHRLVYTNMAPGSYQFVLTGAWVVNNATQGQCIFRLSDGTNSYSPQTMSASTSTSNVFPSLVFSVNVTSAGTRTFTVQAADNHANSCDWFNGANYNASWKIYRFPAQGEPTAAISADQTDYGWTAYTPTFTGFGTVTVSSCWHSRVSQNLLLQCNFTAGTPTAVEARLSLPNNLVIDPTVIPALATVGRGARNVSNAESQVILAEPSVSYVTFGVGASGVTALGKQLGNVVVAAGNVYSFTAVVPIQGWAQNQRAPTLIGSVTSGSVGAERIERVYVAGATETTACTGSPCTLYRNSGAVSSVTRGGTGSYSVNFNAGTFSSTPVCVCMTGSISGALGCLKSVGGTFNSTRYDISTSSSGALVDYPFEIICMGPR
jgi:hypothetical protein